MTQITVTEQGGSGRYIDFGDAAALRDLFNNANGGTIILYVKPGDQTANNYPFCKCDSSGYGMRVTALSTEQIACATYKGTGTTSTSNSGLGGFTQNTWQHWQITFPGNGSLTGTDISIYIDAGSVLASYAPSNATAPIASDAGLTAMILNRPGLGRHFVGDIAYVAAWNRVLDSTERATVRTNGPLDVPSGLVFCFANGQDYGPYSVAVVDRTTQVAGSTPTNTALGGSSLTAVDSDSTASYNVIGTVTQDATTSYSVLSATAVSNDASTTYNVIGSVQSSGSTSYNVLGTVQTDGAASYQILSSITIYDTADRGTLDLTACSVTPNGSTPTISIKNQYSWEENTNNGAKFCFFHVTGVNGLRPVFDVDRSNMNFYNYSGKFKWSYTGEIGTWNDFTTTTLETTPNVYRSQHTSAFTQDTVYVSLANPWRIGYTLPWIQSLESSGYVGYTPSGGSSYQFDTRSATSDHQSVAIAAQPLYSFKISSGAGNAPDGNQKRKLVMFSGVHASEDVGNYALKGAVEFLVSSDPLAVSVRQWFDAYVYPLISSAGRAGGAQRSDFDASSKSSDVNRAWDDSPVLETITKHKAAVATDVGSTVHVFMDFHGDHFNSDDTSYFEGTSGDPYGAKWDAAIDTYDVTSIIYSTSTEYTASWFKANKSCNYCITPEGGVLAEWTPASKEAFGAANIKAVSYLIAQGEFGLPIVQSDISATYTVLNSVSQDAASSYSILATTQVSSSSSADYVVRGAASQDGAATFSVRGLVSRDGAASYSVQTTVSADGSASYQVLSANAVVSSVATSYNVIGTVAASQATSFNVLAAVAADALGSYDILSTDPVLSSALAGYIIVGTVYRDAAASYIIGDQVPYILRSPVTANRYTGPVIGVLQ